jgi:hypothetical protein
MLTISHPYSGHICCNNSLQEHVTSGCIGWQSPSCPWSTLTVELWSKDYMSHFVSIEAPWGPVWSLAFQVSLEANSYPGTGKMLVFCFLFSFFFFMIFLIRYFPHLHFQCYPKSPPYLPPTPPHSPPHSHFLALAFPCTGVYKVCKANGPLFPVMAD